MLIKADAKTQRILKRFVSNYYVLLIISLFVTDSTPGIVNMLHSSFHVQEPTAREKYTITTGNVRKYIYYVHCYIIFKWLQIQFRYYKFFFTIISFFEDAIVLSSKRSLLIHNITDMLTKQAKKTKTRRSSFAQQGFTINICIFVT